MHTKRMNRHLWRLVFFVLGGFMAIFAVQYWGMDATAQDPPAAAEPAAATPAEPAATQDETPPPPTPDSNKEAVSGLGVDVDNLWTLIAAFLVFWMQAGFAMLEGGMTRGKNIVNIGMKNILDFSFASIAFWLVGFAIMFGAGNGFMGLSGWGLQETANADPATFGSISWSTTSLECKYLFQLVFAGTAATIVSGGMAERTKFSRYMIYSIIITAFIYPISGHWIWGEGWLSKLGGDEGPTAGFGMKDFAGSTVVHSVGGWLALCGAFVLGPRIGKYGADGKVNAITGHSFPMMILGVFILWLGWFGFNPGSTMGVNGMGSLIAHIASTTNMAAACGVVGALMTAKCMFGKWDGSMAGNGALAGLVAITCPCAWVDLWASAVIGLLAGILVVVSVIFFDRKLKVDDPVGAISVHGVCGVWGTLSLGLFSNPIYGDDAAMPGLFYGGGATQLWYQIIGVVSVFAWCMVTGFILFYVLKSVGLRVTQEEELKGLDITEHGMEGYPSQTTSA